MVNETIRLISQNDKNSYVRDIIHAMNLGLLTKNQRKIYLDAPEGERRDDWLRRMSEHIKKKYPQELTWYRNKINQRN